MDMTPFVISKQSLHAISCARWNLSHQIYLNKLYVGIHFQNVPLPLFTNPEALAERACKSSQINSWWFAMTPIKWPHKSSQVLHFRYIVNDPAIEKQFLSDEGPMLETLDYTIRIGSTPTFLYFDLYLDSAYAAQFVYVIFLRAYYWKDSWKDKTPPI